MDQSEADLVLHVSNQSFDDERVGLEVVVDGTTRYAVIDHWGAGDSAELTWLFQRESLAFA